MYIDILILSHLIARPHHGYEIKKDIERMLGEDFTVNNNLLYPALRRFEEAGIVRREMERQHGRPDRHLYHLTDTGKAALARMLREFPPHLAGRREEFLVRVALFDLIEPEARRAILAACRTVLERRRAQFAQFHRAAEQSVMYGYAPRVTSFLMGEIEHQIAWIDALAEEIGTVEGPPERAGSDRPM